MLKILRSREAIVDITSAAIYLDEHADTDIAIRFIELCDEAFERLASMPGMEDPLWVWEMLDGSPWTGGMKSGTAPAGIAFYTHEAVPQWRGNLFVAALAGQSLWRLTLEGDRVTGQERLLALLDERMRDVVQGPDGALYLLTDGGRLLRYGV